MSQKEDDVSQGSHLSPEVEDAPLVLLPCVSCKRTFRPEALAKHSKVCEKTLMKKRKTFDSSKQRLQGTEVESFATSPPVAKAATRKSRTKEKLDLEKAIQAVKRPPPDPNPLVRPSDHDECPHCGRFFGPKAFERHTQFCKEQQLKLKSTPTVSQEAKERLKVRTSYKGPLTNKVLNRDRYQPKRDPSPMSSEHRDDTSRSRGLTRNASLRSSFRSRASDTTPPPPLRRTMTQISSTRSRRSREKEEVTASPQQEVDSQRQGMPRLYSREHPDRKVKSPRWNSSVSLSNKSPFNKDVDRNSLPGHSSTVFINTDKNSKKPLRTENRGLNLGIVNVTDLSISPIDSFQESIIICNKEECSMINESSLKSSYHPEEHQIISDNDERNEFWKSTEKHTKQKLSCKLKSNSSIKLYNTHVECNQFSQHQSSDEVLKCNISRTDNTFVFDINRPEYFKEHQNSSIENEHCPDKRPSFHVLESKPSINISSPKMIQKNCEITDLMDKIHKEGSSSLEDSISFNFYKNIDVENSILDPLALPNSCSSRINKKKEKETTRDDSFKRAYSSPEPVISKDCNNSTADNKITNNGSFNFSNTNPEALKNIIPGVADFIQLASSKELSEEKLSTSNKLLSTNLTPFPSVNNTIIFEENIHNHIKTLRQHNSHSHNKSVTTQNSSILPENLNNEGFPLHESNNTFLDKDVMIESDISSMPNRSELPELLVPKQLWSNITENHRDNVNQPKSSVTFDETDGKEWLKHVKESQQNLLDSVKGIEFNSENNKMHNKYAIKNEVSSPQSGGALLSLSPVKNNYKSSNFEISCTNSQGNGNCENNCFCGKQASPSGVSENCVPINIEFVCKSHVNDHCTSREISLFSEKDFFFNDNSLEENCDSYQRDKVFSSSLNQENKYTEIADNFICLDENLVTNVLFDHNQPKCIVKDINEVKQESNRTKSAEACLSMNNQVKKELISQNIDAKFKPHFFKLENSSESSCAFQINDDGNLDPIKNTFKNDEHLFGDLCAKFVNSTKQTSNFDVYSALVKNVTFSQDCSHQNKFDAGNKYAQDFQANVSNDTKCNQDNLLMSSPQLEPEYPTNSFKLKAVSEHSFPNSFCQRVSDLPRKLNRIYLQEPESIKLAYPVLEFVTVARGTACELKTSAVGDYNCNTSNESEELKSVIQIKTPRNEIDEHLLEENIFLEIGFNNIVGKTKSNESGLNEAKEENFIKNYNPLQIKRRPSTHPLCPTYLSNSSEQTQHLSQNHKKKYYSLDSKSFEIVFSSECSDFLRKTFENFNSKSLAQEYRSASFSSSGVDLIENSTSPLGVTDEDSANSYSVYFRNRDDTNETTKINPHFIEKPHVFKEDSFISRNVEESGSSIDKNLKNLSTLENNVHEVCCLDYTMKNCSGIFHKPFQQSHLNNEDELSAFSPEDIEESFSMFPPPSELESFSEDSLEREMSDSLSKADGESTYSDSLSGYTPEKSPILFWNDQKLFHPCKGFENKNSEKCNFNNIDENNVDRHFPHQGSKPHYCSNSEHFSEADFGLNFQIGNNNNSCNKLKSPYNDYKFHTTSNALPPLTVYKKISKETEKISVKSCDLSAQVLYENTQIIKENLCNIGSSGCTSESENSIPLSSSCDDDNTFCFKHLTKQIEYFQNDYDYHTVKTSVYELPKLESYNIISSSKLPRNSAKSSKLTQDLQGFYPSLLSKDTLKLPPIEMVRPALNSPINGNKLNYVSMPKYNPIHKCNKKINNSNSQLYSKLNVGDSNQHSKTHGMTDEEGHCYKTSRLPCLILSRNSLMNTTHKQDSPCMQQRKNSPILERSFPNSARPPLMESYVNWAPPLHTSSTLYDRSSKSNYSMKVEEISKHLNNETEKHKNFRNISHNSIDSAYSRSAGGGEGEPAQTELPSFCHECGTRYPVITAKFCCNCGMKRIVL